MDLKIVADPVEDHGNVAMLVMPVAAVVTVLATVVFTGYVVHRFKLAF
jgi:hypothetical protein